MPEILNMIMQRIEPDDYEPEGLAPLPFNTDEIADECSYSTGFLYRGVPQDPQRRTLRIDFVGNPKSGLKGPVFLTSAPVRRETNSGGLYFG